MFYVLKDLNDDTKLKIEDRTSAAGTICAAPENESIEWLDIEDVLDPDKGGIIGKKAVVNQDKKAQALSDKDLQKTDRDDQQSKRGLRIDKLKLAFNNMDNVVADPVKLEKLLKQMLVTIVNLRE